ncbi:metal-dependent hydrolase [Ruficoccus amylovorans]|uniref:UPF0173 metal-dependent hydrolase H5P28_12470 n=1 Tax=Ruficoccus amylovorans TaxID=1804625 RepID=A0A842HEX1_9BACT|nr:metal-dependent hydrolase [Ruficoccus amylovorans]MBC2595073.1 metal-dependent hydrolase [Ruficoccus amylovorans]
MKLTYFGHSACLLETEEHKLLFDPFISDNPLCTVKLEDIQCDYILLTHGHSDHYGDTESISRANDAPVIATFELASYCGSKGLRTVPMNIGGSAEFPFGRVKLTSAHHSSSYPGPNGLPIYMGEPAGILVMSEGQTFYHAGDTSLTMDMKLTGELHEIDLALLPIGDHFTMGIFEAIKAVGFLKPKRVVPCHYNTFPPIETDPMAFVSKLAETEDIVCEGHVLAPGESLRF